jgi:hypothetical protein
LPAISLFFAGTAVRVLCDHKSFYFANPEEGYFFRCHNFGFPSYLPRVPPWTILSA